MPEREVTVEEVKAFKTQLAWKTAADAAPWLLGEAKDGGKPQPCKERVAEDIRSDGDQALSVRRRKPPWYS